MEAPGGVGSRVPPTRLALAGVALLWLAVGCFWPPAAPALEPSAAPTRPAEQKPRLDKILAGLAPESAEDLRAMQAHLLGLIDHVLACTVSVRVGAAQGSGVIVSNDGYVLTAAHVVGEPNQDAMIITTDGRRWKGKTLGRDSNSDAGLMKITETGAGGEAISWPFAKLGASAELQPGLWCVATGHPNGYQRDRKPVVRFGRVRAHSEEFIQTDCLIFSGDSGGPLFDMNGDVIGVHSRISNSLDFNLHVPVNAYRASWDRLAKGESWGGEPFIGVEGAPDSELAKIAQVFPGGAAAKAGVKAGDIITQFDGEQVTDFASLAALVGARAPGSKAKVVVRRGKDAIELELVVGRKES